MVIATRSEFLLVGERGGGSAELVPADMVEMVVRIDDVGYIPWVYPDQLQLPWDRLHRRLLRQFERQDLLHVRQVVSRVEEKLALRMVHQRAVARETNRATRSGVPVEVVPVDDERTSVEEIYLNILRHTYHQLSQYENMVLGRENNKSSAEGRQEGS